MRTTVVLLLLVAAISEAARISVSRGKKDHPKPKIDELCARMHNNTALEGADPLMMLQATAYECQKRCVDMYPTCSAVVYYYLHNETKHHYCYLFEQNSAHEKMELVEQKADNRKDLVRMLEIVSSCRMFDGHPPLLEDGHASSTDKVDRKKRQMGEVPLQAGDWTDWSPCSNGGHEVRSQPCVYGRKIQRRGCPARQYPQRAPAPPVLAPVIHTPYPQDPKQSQDPRLSDPRYAHGGQQGAVDPRQDPRLQQQQHPDPRLQQQQQQHPDPRQDPRLQQQQLDPRQDPRLQQQQQQHIDPRQDPRLQQQQQQQPDPRLQQQQQQPDPRQDPRYQQQQQPNGGQSPLDAQAQAYQQRMAHYRENQRHPAVQQAAPCVATEQGLVCEDPRQRQPQPPSHGLQQQTLTHGQPPQTQTHQLRPQVQVSQPYPPTYVPAPRAGPAAGYRPAPPPAPACNGVGCEVPASVPGQWYEWSDFSECSCTCGDGVKQRRRECATNNCQGPEYEQAPCNLGPCQTWSEWCEWSTCSGSCGQGVKTRTRFCHLGTQRCEGPDFESSPCDAGPCPEWSQWEDWNQCSASCGPGLQVRQRTCLGGVHGDICQGPRTEERSCESAACSSWADWAEWGQCSSSCGDGMKRRTRICQYGTDCAGPAEETMFCYGPPCASWTEWCEWSGCSSKCGPGQRTRTRACLGSDGKESRECQGNSIETILCEGTNCCRWSEWCHWSMCDKECGGGQSIRTRTCSRDGVGSDDNCHCDGPDREEKECNSQSCSPQCTWTQWCAWSDCSTQLSCEVGVQARSRQCVGELGCHCLGPAEESQQCRGRNPCPQQPPC